MAKTADNVKSAVTYTTAKKCMERSRNAVVPSTSDSISVIADKLVAGNVYPPLPQSGFLGAVKVKNFQRRGPREHVAIILGDNDLIERAIETGTTTVFCDATFRITPKQARSVGKRGAQVTLKAVFSGYLQSSLNNKNFSVQIIFVLYSKYVFRSATVA